MEKRSLLATSFLILTVVTVLHHLALEYKLYFTFCWLDLLVHFLAAMGVVFAIFWWLHSSKIFPGILLSSDRILLTGFLTVLFIGVAWELFELWAGVPFTSSYRLDTLLDVFMDLTGGVAASLYISRVGVVEENAEEH